MNICGLLSQLFKNNVQNETFINFNEKQTSCNKVKENDHEYIIITHLVNIKKKNTCTICLEILNNCDKITTKCNHNFHYKCINSWCDISNSCPLCRYSYPI